MPERRSKSVNDLVLWDFGIHWFDFLTSIIGARAEQVQATSARSASQTVRPPLLAQALVGFSGGQASLVFDGDTHHGPRDSTMIVGSQGTASSSGPDLGNQTVELHTAAGIARPSLRGKWFNDGFAGAMGELLCAIEENREPMNGARGNLVSLRLCQAATRSSEMGTMIRLDQR